MVNHGSAAPMAIQFENYENTDTTGEEQFSARELSVLNEIATLVSSASDISDVYSSFSALVADLITWDGIIVNTPTAEGNLFEIVVREGEGVPGQPAGTLFEVAGSFYGETVRTRSSQYVTADEGQTAELALRIPGLRASLLAGFRSFLSAPLQSQGEIVGAIHVQTFKSHAFTEHDRILLEKIAVFVGPTVERFAAYEAMKQEAYRTQSMLRIGRLLLSARDIGDVFERFVEEMKTVVDIDRMTIAVVVPGGEAVVDRHLYGIHVPGREVNNVISMDELQTNGLDINSHGYIMSTNTLMEADPVTAPGMYANYKAGLRSVMFAGLRSEGQLVGTINVKSAKEDAYSASDLDYFEQVTDHVAASIERTLSHESEVQMTRAAQERLEDQRESSRVVDVIKAKERLLSSASHELRTPLTGILAFVDLLSRNRTGNLDEKQLRYLSIVHRNAEDLSTKVNSLIDHAARDAGQLNIKLEKFDLTPMLQEAITDAIPKLAELGQSASLEVLEDIVIVGDRRQLLVALSHLIDNSARYTPKDSTIRLTGEVFEGFIEISVIDQGSGIPDEHADGIFDPFERGDLASMAENPGAGLGLTYVRAVAAGHSGEARYESMPGGGAKFTISVPSRTDTRFQG
jgi:signal transduction histidine kinase